VTLRNDSRPRLARKARLRFDRHAGARLLLYPERGLVLNATAGEILELCTGEHRVDEIVDCVAAAIPTAPRTRIERDVLTFLDALATRGLIQSP
jgi:pyrroloquinoline quinone biosynthesis protein D